MLRTSPDDLSVLLDDAEANATAWEFFALVRAIEHVSPDAPRIGTALDPADETVDLAHEPSNTFPRTTVAGFDRDRRRPRLRSLHLGLTGPMGPMPLHMTEIAMFERAAKGSNPLGDMLDMVSTRMLQGYYRAWASGNPCAQADRPPDDDFAGFLGAASGATTLRFVSGAEREIDDEPGFGDWRRLAYGGHLSGLRSAAAVGDLLGHALERTVGVDESVGRWRDIPREARTRIGRRGAHHQLGTGATLGGRFFAVEWDVAFKVRARSMDDLERLLPGGEVHRLLVEAATAVLPQHIEWHARIEIDEAAIAPARIGRGATGARLGMTGWIAPRGRSRLRNDVRLGGRMGIDRQAKGIGA
ncbi:type VI secretion system baseplate subunit TssG [Sphingomonas sp.]|uniref:type VI secretion system baseplate subunit TssG n=1 Tax=Sphingomonas sp. TaxID=28214 RepID=UPI0035BC85DB